MAFSFVVFCSLFLFLLHRVCGCFSVASVCYFAVFLVVLCMLWASSVFFFGSAGLCPFKKFLAFQKINYLLVSNFFF